MMRVAGRPDVEGPPVEGRGRAGEQQVEVPPGSRVTMLSGGGPAVAGQAVAAAPVRRAAPAGQRGQDARLPGLAGRGVPAALHYAVVEAVPGRACGVPHPRAELHQNLGVGAERFLADGAPVQRRDRDPAQVDLAQHGERQGQHDMVGGHVADRAAAVEAAAVSRPVAAATATRRWPGCSVPRGSRSRMPVMSWSLPPWRCHFSSAPASWGASRGWAPLSVLASWPSR